MKCRVIALYLPQFHPIEENNKWWGEGFTEWTNVAKAKKFFKNHNQPHIPADLGFYDLRLSESREAQANMAKKFGIEGFCYWHYWFGNGKKLLERPFEEVLKTRKPDFPFCLAWANHSWEKKSWNPDGKGNKILIEQNYPGKEDIINHFYYLLPAFKDKRYVRVNGRCFFGIYSPLTFNDVDVFISIWNKLATKNGLKEFYFVGFGGRQEKERILEKGFDAVNDTSIFGIKDHQSKCGLIIKKIIARFFKYPLRFKYNDAIKYMTDKSHKEINTIPTIVPSWDHTPRSGKKGIVLEDSNPRAFKKHVESIVDEIKDKPFEERIVLLKSWNEWGEGNYIEPDLEYGKAKLEKLYEVIRDE